jgi:hypothetical protein
MFRFMAVVLGLLAMSMTATFSLLSLLLQTIDTTLVVVVIQFETRDVVAACGEI